MNRYNKDEKTKKLKKIEKDKSKESDSQKSIKNKDIKVITNHDKTLDTDSKSSKNKTKDSFIINFD